MATRDGSSGKVNTVFHTLGFLILYGGVFLAGYFDRAPMILWPLLAICTGTAVASRWRGWRRARQAGVAGEGPMRPVKAVVITVVAVLVLYAVGRGVESLKDAQALEALGFVDWLICGIMLAVGTPLRVFGSSFALFFAEAVGEEIG